MEVYIYRVAYPQNIFARKYGPYALLESCTTLYKVIKLLTEATLLALQVIALYTDLTMREPFLVYGQISLSWPVKGILILMIFWQLLLVKKDSTRFAFQLCVL